MKNIFSSLFKDLNKINILSENDIVVPNFQLDKNEYDFTKNFNNHMVQRLEYLKNIVEDEAIKNKYENGLKLIKLGFTQSENSKFVEKYEKEFKEYNELTIIKKDVEFFANIYKTDIITSEFTKDLDLIPISKYHQNISNNKLEYIEKYLNYYNSIRDKAKKYLLNELDKEYNKDLNKEDLIKEDLYKFKRKFETFHIVAKEYYNNCEDIIKYFVDFYDIFKKSPFKEIEDRMRGWSFIYGEDYEKIIYETIQKTYKLNKYTLNQLSKYKLLYLVYDLFIKNDVSSFLCRCEEDKYREYIKELYKNFIPSRCKMNDYCVYINYDCGNTIYYINKMKDTFLINICGSNYYIVL